MMSISTFSSFDEYRFKQQLAHAMAKVKLVLDTDRNPQLPEDVPHTYGDKVRPGKHEGWAARATCYLVCHA